MLFVILRWATHGAKLLPRRGAVTGLFLIFYGLFRMRPGERARARPRHAGLPAGPHHGHDAVPAPGAAGIGLFWLSRRPGSMAPPAEAAATPLARDATALPPETAAEPFDTAVSGMDERTAESFAPDPIRWRCDKGLRP